MYSKFNYTVISKEEFDKVTKRELSQKAKLSVYLAIFVPTLTYGHEMVGRNEFSETAGWHLPQRRGAKFSHPRETWSRTAALTLGKEPA